MLDDIDKQFPHIAEQKRLNVIIQRLGFPIIFELGFNTVFFLDLLVKSAGHSRLKTKFV